MAFKLKLGKHYGIERFGVIFLGLSGCMVLLMSTIIIGKVKSDHQSLTGRTVYISSFSMSKSGTEGQVVSMSTNEDYTKAFVLLHFDSMSNISLDANDYQLFLTGTNLSGAKKTLLSNPSGAVYVFGSTGYVGFYFRDVNGFPEQLTNVVLRCNKDIVNSDVTVGPDSDSFTKYDQAKFVFNFHGEWSHKADFLKDDTLDVNKMYNELLISTKESDIKAQLRDDLKSMNQKQSIMTEYMNRLDSDGLTIPSVPSEIANDKICAKGFNGKILTWSQDNGAYQDEDGYWYKDSDYQYYLDTDYVVPGGYDFNWQDGSVEDGYFKDVAKDETWNSFLANQTKKQAEPSTFTTDVKWYNKDGSEFVYDSEAAENGDTQMATTNSDITTLVNAWSAYFDLKKQYQTTDMGQLLYLERDAEEAVSNYTVNMDDDVITIY